MAFDVARGRVVMFGGDSLQSRLFNDTWEWDGTNWAQVQDIGPPPRLQHAMAYEAARQRVLLFGGNGGGVAMGDTWQWDGDGWSQLTDTGPFARSGHALAYDSRRSRVMLFGGTIEGQPMADTWEWDGSDWLEVGNEEPPARQGHGLAFDEARSRIVMFGGVGGEGLQSLGDTWEFDGTQWTQVADFGPPPCVDLALTFSGSGVLLYGGVGSLSPSDSQPVFGTTWEWTGAQWRVRQDIGPGPRVGHAMAFDAARQRVVLLGGLPVPPNQAGASELVLGDVWEAFEEDTPPPTPPALASFVIQPPTVLVGDSFTLTVTLTGPAPVGGFAVSLSARITVGGILIDFPVTSTIVVPVGSRATVVSAAAKLPPIIDPGSIDPNGIPVVVTARAGDVTRTASFTLRPR
jgi:hypothetical protein